MPAPQFAPGVEEETRASVREGRARGRESLCRRDGRQPLACTRVYTHVYAHVYAHVYTRIFTRVHARINRWHVRVSIHMSIHMSVHMSIHMSVHMFIHMPIHVSTAGMYARPARVDTRVCIHVHTPCGMSVRPCTCPSVYPRMFPCVGFVQGCNRAITM